MVSPQLSVLRMVPIVAADNAPAALLDTRRSSTLAASNAAKRWIEV
ncbi:hypothetical protein OM076_41500 [Solirubrobacter ginsenosidimutans]|uniref:Uncharacterized protein n=1 Tax=Solirubrobacter ginsenosidimutans TaxID=490573 RepID=A0A9X3N1T2_9ACTN|nr:hypothetical protein [Solirubrobacter ginsenosidimutans]MDA0166810.1 hypothetical protein [Solirubrobacter ginsenosidimutans]